MNLDQIPLPPNLWIYLASFVLSGLGGVAALLKSGKPSSLMLISSFLNSSLLGLAAILLWERWFPNNLSMLIGVCLLLGLMGASGQELVVSIAKKQLKKIFGDYEKDEKPKTDQNNEK